LPTPIWQFAFLLWNFRTMFWFSWILFLSIRRESSLDLDKPVKMRYPRWLNWDVQGKWLVWLSEKASQSCLVAMNSSTSSVRNQTKSITSGLESLQVNQFRSHQDRYKQFIGGRNARKTLVIDHENKYFWLQKQFPLVINQF
jgi:hypothetical protein